MVYLVLVVGAITTVYPFLLMMTTGFKGPTDQNDNKIVPTYFSKMDGPGADGKPDLGTLEWKYLNDKYVADPQLMTNLGKADRAFLHDHMTFAESEVARNQLSNDGTRKLLLKKVLGERS